eukprot:m.183684 g.183684  ORF g.183684 m.183684 type:complete len:220 (-) comp15915_c0_seq1:107-766(-)
MRGGGGGERGRGRGGRGGGRGHGRGRAGGRGGYAGKSAKNSLTRMNGAGVDVHLRRLKSKVKRLQHKKKSGSDGQGEASLGRISLDDTDQLVEQLKRSGKSVGDVESHFGVSNTDGNGQTGASTSHGGHSAGDDGSKTTPIKKRKGIQGALTEAKERKQELKAAQKKAAEEAQERERAQRQRKAQRREWSSKLTKKTRRGQPVLSHHIDHVMAKLGLKK